MTSRDLKATIKTSVGLFVLFTILWCVLSPFSSLLEALGGNGFGRIDLLQYWSSARLFIEHKNPYDPELLKSLQSSVSSLEGLPIIMWNPPFIFPCIVVLGALSFEAAVLFAFLAACGAFAGSVLLLTSCFGILNRSTRMPILVFVITFYPFALSLFYGQVTPLLLIGLSAAVCLGRKVERREEEGTRALLLAAGLCFSIAVLKPHLLYLPMFYFLLGMKTRANRTVVCGSVLGAAVLLVLAVSWEPRIFRWYCTAMSSPPYYWQTPTLGSFLQGWTGSHVLRFLPSVLTAFWLVLHRLKRGSGLSWETVLGLVPLSLVTSPYGWVYDQMLVLPTALSCFDGYEKRSKGRRAGILILLFASNLLMMVLAGAQQHFVWYPLAILAAKYLAEPELFLVQGPGKAL